MKRRGFALFGSAALIAAWQAQAQTAATPAKDSAQNQGIVVNGRRMPTAEAPRSATCEALVRNDPSLRAQLEAAGGNPLMGPTFFLPTRMPRNADYNAPPLSPPGSALPETPKSRFGARGKTDRGQSNALDPVNPAQTNASEILALDPDPSLLVGDGQALDPDVRMANALAVCRGTYAADGGRSAMPGMESDRSDARADGIGRLNDRASRGRAYIVAHDSTLPTALALFDQRRFNESFQWFRRAFSKLQWGEGGDEAALFIGKLYLQGLGDNPDPLEGVKWLKKVASSPFDARTQTPVFDPRQPDMNTAMGEAAVILGNIYRTGFKSIPKDLAESRKWYARALEVGHLAAANALGEIHANGAGVPRDAKKAADYYLKAAKFGLPSAQYALAELYYYGGDGVPADVQKALLWYKTAAKGRHSGALFALGRAYDLGEGVKADPQMAAGLYKSAALQGNSAAEAALGSFFYEGKVLPRDPAMARKWFEQAARGADPEGMFNLAAMMARGEGGTRDLVRAWAWMKRASVLGNDNAPTALAALERRMSSAEKQAAAALLASN
ncbi:MAG: tetratricopeptide repeat protein [Sphingomicrobium sp.]